MPERPQSEPREPNHDDSHCESFLEPEGEFRFDSVAQVISPAVGRRLGLLRHAAGYPPSNSAAHETSERTIEELQEFPEDTGIGIYLGPRDCEQLSFYEAGQIASASNRTVHLLTDTSRCISELDCLVLNPHLIDCPEQADPQRTALDALAEHGRILMVGPTSARYVFQEDFRTIESDRLRRAITHSRNLTQVDQTGALEMLSNTFAA